MRRIIDGLGITLFFIGFGGIAGAIEMETNIVKPILVTLIGITIMTISLIRGGINEKSGNHAVVSSVGFTASRPSYLR